MASVNTCPCGQACACHANPAFPPPCDVPGGCGSATAPECAAATCTRPAAPGHVLCRSDGEKLGQWLAQLLDEVAMLDATPSMAGREPGTGGPGGLASQRSVGNLDVMVLRDRRSRARDAEDLDGNAGRSAYEILSSYAAVVRDERQLVRSTVDLAYRRRAAPPGPVCDVDAPPCGHHTCEVWTFRAVVTPRLTVASERRVLADHLDWILSREWAGEFYDEMRQLWALLRRVNGHPRPAADPVLTTAQVAAKLGISDRGVRKAVERGRLATAGRDAAGWLFRSSEVALYQATTTRRDDEVA
jgi:hypothetical protein